jgi:hypothetical protein
VRRKLTQVPVYPDLDIGPGAARVTGLEQGEKKKAASGSGRRPLAARPRWPQLCAGDAWTVADPGRRVNVGYCSSMIWSENRKPFFGIML